MTAPLVLFGPTASGKSALALALAARDGAEIVSMDSMSVYRGMDIGTAKPTPDERARVRHHCVDVVAPADHYDVACWVRDATAALSDCAARGVAAILCGGTGLYLRACERGLAPGPPQDPAVRAELLDRADREGRAALHAELSAVDPTVAARLHPNDLKRVTRALEVHVLTGKPLSAWHADTAPLLTDATYVVVDRDDADLRARIDARTASMFDADLLDEARRLLALGLPLAPEPAQAVGYAEAFAVVRGELPMDAARAQIARRTWRLARHQRTWARALAAKRVLRWAADESVGTMAARLPG